MKKGINKSILFYIASVLFFREVHFDNHKAFKKYLLK